MKRSRFSEEHIVYAIGQAESGTPVGDVCRQLGIAEQTSYAWKKKYAHLGVNELRRLRQVEKGERPAQTACGRSLARQTHAVGGLAKKRLRPARRRELAAWFQDTFQVSCPRACRSSVGPSGIVAVERRINRCSACVFERSPRPARAFVTSGSGACCDESLAREPEASPAVLPAGWTSVADAGAAAQAQGLASRPRADADRPLRALEYGCCASDARRWAAISNFDGRR